MAHILFVCQMEQEVCVAVRCLNNPFFSQQVWQMAENIYNDEELDTPASEAE